MNALQSLFYLTSQHNFDTIDYFFIDCTSVKSHSSGFSQPLWLYLLTFPHRSKVFSQPLFINVPLGSCKKKKNAPPFHSRHSPSVISPILTLSTIFYIHIPPMCISPAKNAFLNYKSTCLDTYWSSLLGDLTYTTNLTCTNLNSSTSSVPISENSTAMLPVSHVRNQGIILSYFLSQIYKPLSYSVDFITQIPLDLHCHYYDPGHYHLLPRL